MKESNGQHPLGRSQYREHPVDQGTTTYAVALLFKHKWNGQLVLASIILDEPGDCTLTVEQSTLRARQHFEQLAGGNPDTADIVFVQSSVSTSFVQITRKPS